MAGGALVDAVVAQLHLERGNSLWGRCGPAGAEALSGAARWAPMHNCHVLVLPLQYCIAIPLWLIYRTRRLEVVSNCSVCCGSLSIDHGAMNVAAGYGESLGVAKIKRARQERVQRTHVSTLDVVDVSFNLSQKCEHMHKKQMPQDQEKIMKSLKACIMMDAVNRQVVNGTHKHIAKPKIRMFACSCVRMHASMRAPPHALPRVNPSSIGAVVADGCSPILAQSWHIRNTCTALSEGTGGGMAARAA